MSNILDSHQRYQYRPRQSPPFKHWSEDKGLAVYIAINLEHFSFSSSEGAKLIASKQMPDVLNFSWRDYGNRVGAWYLADLFEEFTIPPAVICNTAILDYCPELLDHWLALRGSELIAHGHTNSERQGAFSCEQEQQLIANCQQWLTQYQGKPVSGWLSPWISESEVTPDLLVKEGFSYTLNWAHDDNPVLMETTDGKLISIPYPQELNDIPTIIPNGASIDRFCRMIDYQFQELFERSKTRPQVMAIALHPYIVGQPFRLHLLRKTLKHLLSQRDKFWLTTPAKIAERYNQAMPIP
jgi:allantoinase